MEFKTVRTNYFGDAEEKEVKELLEKGYAVRVSADCIGHTRAAMVEASARDYFEKLGCDVVEDETAESSLWRTYYRI